MSHVGGHIFESQNTVFRFFMINVPCKSLLPTIYHKVSVDLAVFFPNKHRKQTLVFLLHHPANPTNWRPGDLATRQPGDPSNMSYNHLATQQPGNRQPGDPSNMSYNHLATRQFGDPATRRPFKHVMQSLGDPATRRSVKHVK